METTNKHKKINQDNFVDSLMRNAIDFLKKSVVELDISPKYSVINFCAALELFLKSRLLMEHWSLIVTKQHHANISKFISGDFHSVGMQEAITRIENICGEKIPDKAIKKFEDIRNHRNKLIHFFHEKYLSKPDTKTLDEVIPEQYSAWYYLHQLLTIAWKQHFHKFQHEINALNRAMYRHKEFLQAKYEALTDKIKEEKQAGTKFSSCWYCNLPAAKIDGGLDPLFTCNCLVCQMHNNFLEVACPDCNSSIQVKDAGVGVCEKCGFKTDIDFLISIFGPYEDPKEDKTRAYCGICEFTERRTVVPFGSDYLCLNCLETITDHPEYCDWCNELVAGMDMDGSRFGGCVLCEGKGGDDWGD